MREENMLMEKQKRSIFVNGKIFTSDDANPYADAMIVEDGAIAWIGKQQDMPQKSYASVNLGGKRVLPGFVDAHMHPLLLAEYNKQISCLPPKINSIAELIKEIRHVRSRQEPGQWIQGWGYDEGKLTERRSPNRYDLDKGCADSPISITRTCAHIRCINSKALEMAGIDRNTPDPPGGEIDRDENGEPTGILRENAKNLVADILPKTTNESMLEELIEMGNILASQGITALCDMGCLEKETDRYDDYVEASSKGFRQKVGIYYMWEHFVHDADFNIPANRFSRENQIRAAGLKLIGDGSVSGKTAWMNRPYINTQDGYGMWIEVVHDRAVVPISTRRTDMACGSARMNCWRAQSLSAKRTDASFPSMPWAQKRFTALSSEYTRKHPGWRGKLLSSEWSM